MSGVKEFFEIFFTFFFFERPSGGNAVDNSRDDRDETFIHTHTKIFCY